MSLSFSVIGNGDSAFDIRFDAPPSEALSQQIIALEQAVNAQHWKGIHDLIPAYQCLTICFDPLLVNSEGLCTQIEALTQQVLSQPLRNRLGSRKSHLIRIPVCYEPEFASDMQTVCAQSGLTREQIIARHTAPRYLVHMLGFTPGFLYLGGLDPALHCPRKTTPALRVPAGAVGIGGSQTGIYPQATPGGWQIIGRTPVSLFRPQSSQPFIAEPLDKVSFFAIDRTQFANFEQNTLEVIELGPPV
jgi:inhibitor of KinA